MGDAGARARQPKQGEAVPALALHPPQASTPLTSEHRGRASSGRNRRNRQTKDTTTHQLGLSMRCLFLRKERSGARTPRGRWQERWPPRSRQRRISLAVPSPCVSRHSRLQCMLTFCRKNHVQAVSCPAPAAAGLSGTSPQHPHLSREAEPRGQGRVGEHQGECCALNKRSA